MLFALSTTTTVELNQVNEPAHMHSVVHSIPKILKIFLKIGLKGLVFIDHILMQKRICLGAGRGLGFLKQISVA